jgi:hypothetical protein
MQLLRVFSQMPQFHGQVLAGFALSLKRLQPANGLNNRL